MTPSPEELARKSVAECSPEHIIIGLKSHEMGIPSNPISGSGCACETCISKALKAYGDERVEEAVRILDERARIMNILGCDKDDKLKMTTAVFQGHIVLEIQKLATAIRALKSQP